MEYINQLRSEGKEMVTAVWGAVRTRTRPVLMSSTTTIMGMAPIALGIGEGGGLLSPLAITAMGGLFSSTVLTLIVLPCLYIIVNRFMEKCFGYEEKPLEESSVTPPPA